MKKYVQINVSGWEGGYHVYAIECTKQHFHYCRRNFGHYHFNNSEVEIGVFNQCAIKHWQAENIALAYIEGKFYKEDTGGWD